jgi:hypothetical protein
LEVGISGRGRMREGESVKEYFVHMYENRTMKTHTYNPATQEAEIRRIAVRSQLRQIVLKTLS